MSSALGELALLRKDTAEATSWYEKAAKVDPQAIAPSLKLGAHYLATNQAPKALALGRTLQTAHPTDAGVLELLGQSQAANKDLNGALEKNNTGLDLRQLFIGSEGTLGIITEATLKLTRVPEGLNVFLFAVPDLAGVLALFREARMGPFVVMAYEFFTEKCQARLRRHRSVRMPLRRSIPGHRRAPAGNRMRRHRAAHGAGASGRRRGGPALPQRNRH